MPHGMAQGAESRPIPACSHTAAGHAVRNSSQHLRAPNTNGVRNPHDVHIPHGVRNPNGVRNSNGVRNPNNNRIQKSTILQQDARQRRSGLEPNRQTPADGGQKKPGWRRPALATKADAKDRTNPQCPARHWVRVDGQRRDQMLNKRRSAIVALESTGNAVAPSGVARGVPAQSSGGAEAAAIRPECYDLGLNAAFQYSWHSCLNVCIQAWRARDVTAAARLAPSRTEGHAASRPECHDLGLNAAFQ